MSWIKRIVPVFICFMFLVAGTASAATSKIGILVFDGLLTSDVTVGWVSKA